MKKIAYGAIMALMMTTAAHAEWATTIEEDLFSDGNTAVMIGAISAQSSIYARCAAGKLQLAYIEADADADEVKEPIELGDIVFKGDNGERHVSKTSIYRHNSRFIGFTFDDEDRILDVIRDFGKANSRISVGLDLVLSDEPITVTASARGSSRAVTRFLEACDIEG